MAPGITPKQDSQLSALFSKLLPFNMHQLYWTRRREWQPTPVFLPGESHGQRSVAGMVHGVTGVGHDLAMVKNLPTVWETWVWSLGWEDSLEFPGGVHGSRLQSSCLKNPHGQWYQVSYIPWGHRELDTTWMIRHTFNKLPLPGEVQVTGGWAYQCLPYHSLLLYLIYHSLILCLKYFIIKIMPWPVQ